MEWLVVAFILLGLLAIGHSFRRRQIEQASIAKPALGYNYDGYRFGGVAEPEYRIEYADTDGVVTARDIFVSHTYERGGSEYLDCWCFLRDERRTFRADRMLSIINLTTNRRVQDIAAHRERLYR